MTKHAQRSGPRRAVALVRISKDRENETSTTTQREAIERYCHLHNIELVKTPFQEEGVSAYKRIKRPKLEQAIRLLETGKADVLIVWKLDRLFRRLDDYYELWPRIKKVGGIISITQPIDTTTAIGEGIMGMFFGLAEEESAIKRDRTTVWHDKRKSEALPPGGRRPFGYKRERNKLIVVESEASVIRWMADSVLNGMTLMAIHKRLVADGVNGSRGVPIGMPGIKGVLISPTTAGLREYDGGYVEGSWDAILDRSTWEQLCAILTDPTRRTNFTDGKPAHLLTGIIRCDKCKAKLRYKRHRQGPRYLCRDCNCSIPVDVADKAVGKYLVDSIDPTAWQAMREQGRAHDPAVIDGILAEKAKALEHFQAGIFDVDEYAAIKAALNVRMEAANNDEPIDLPDIRDLQTGWKGLPLDGKRMVIDAFLDDIRLAQWNGTFKTPAHERILIESR